MMPIILPRIPTSLRVSMPILPLILMFGSGLLLAPGYAAAVEEEDSEKPIYLEADSAELSDAESLSVYTGNVIVRQGSMELRGDRVTMHHDPERKPTLIIAVGAPATYQQQIEGEGKNFEAKALRMEYDRSRDEITLIDQAVLFQGEDTFRNDRIVYDRAQARVTAGTIAKGKKRVRIEITPADR